MALLTLLALSVVQPGPAPPAAEPISAYKISLRQNGASLDIRGSADFPRQERSEFDFTYYLSALIPEPHFSLTCNGRPLPIRAMASVLDGGDRKWTLRASRPCGSGSALRLGFRYTLRGIAAPQMHLSDRFSFAGGGGELWYPQRSFAERQTGMIEVDVPDGFVAIATGALTLQRRSGGRRLFRYSAASPAKLAFAYGPYADATTRRARVLSDMSRDAALALVRRLEPYIAALTRTFGTAPFTTFALVEVPFDGRALGTSEYGMIFAQRARMQGAFDAAYWAHEFGHQWWGNSVRPTSGTPGATLLTEGLAHYGAMTAVEEVQGPHAGLDFRTGTLTPNPPQSVLNYRSLARDGQDRAPATFLPKGQDEILLAHNLATSKGALVLRYFASLVGQEQFHAAIRSFLAAKRNGRTSWAEFEDWIHQQTRGEYRWFFEQWLHRPGAPRLTVSYCPEARRVTGEVRQIGATYRLILPMEVRGNWGSRRVEASMSGERHAFSFEAPGPVETLTVDPQALVPTAAATVVERSCS